MTLNDSFRPYVLACLAALILGLPTFINGSALFYEDSPLYVARGVGPLRAIGGDFQAGRLWLRDGDGQLSAKMAGQPAGGLVAESKKQASERIWPAGRSVVYSIVTYLLYVITGFTGVVAVQALLVALPITLLWERCLDLPDRWLLGASAILAVATSLGLFVGLVMPDFMAAAVILVPAMLLAFRSRFSILDTVTLWAILVYATMIHDSHLVILSILVVVAWVLYLVGFCRKIGEKGAAAPTLVTLALCGGLLASEGYAALAIHVTGKPLQRLPHLTAHLSGMMLGVDFLNQNCPQVGFEICRYRDKLPLGWTDFMFGPLLRNQPYAESRRISEEQIPFFLAVFKDHPLATTIAFGKDALKQLFMISYFDLDQARKIPWFAADEMPPSVIGQMVSSLLVRHPQLLDIQSVVQQASVLISIPILVILGVRLSGTADPLIKRSHLFAAVVISGVIINGLVCGFLAFPYDRFQARVIWLLPFLGIAGLALACSRTLAARRG